MFALRLLELEQKFESYCTIHEEELKEIKTILDQLREDILRNSLDQPIVSPKKYPVSSEITDTSGNSGERDKR
jgi:hypothetical protein